MFIQQNLSQNTEYNTILEMVDTKLQNSPNIINLQILYQGNLEKSKGKELSING